MSGGTPDARCPSEPQRALAARNYSDPTVLAAERERIFFRTWQLACHVSEVAAPGDYLSFELFDQGLFIARARDGGLRAFYNVCAHRAHELLSGRGNRPVITCPYHGWAYGLDGRLRSAPNGASVPGFEASAICLTEVRLELAAGFVFVNLDPAAPGPAETFDTVSGELTACAPKLESWSLAHRSEQILACNWKVAVENYSECYHCPGAHPFLAEGVLDMASYRIRADDAVHRHSCRARPADEIAYATGEAERADFASWYLWPNAALEVYPGGYLDLYRWRPLDVATTLQSVEWYARDGSAAAEVQDLAECHLANTVAEDQRLVEAVQRGLGSRGYHGGPLMADREATHLSEHAVGRFQDMVARTLAD